MYHDSRIGKTSSRSSRGPGSDREATERSVKIAGIRRPFVADGAYTKGTKRGVAGVLVARNVSAPGRGGAMNERDTG